MKISCSTCKYCESQLKFGNMNALYQCNHPNQEYIQNFCKNHKYTKTPGVIGYASGGKFTMKGTPRWCPLKRRW